jgi:hypothetical protein
MLFEVLGDVMPAAVEIDPPTALRRHDGGTAEESIIRTAGIRVVRAARPSPLSLRASTSPAKGRER